VISLEVKGLSQAQARLAAGVREMPGLGERVVRSLSILMRRKLVERMSAPLHTSPFWGRTSPPGLAYLGVRSGQSRDRISPGGIIFRRGKEITSSVGSPDRHVAFLEKGGTIFGHQFLRIPTAAAQTPAGVDRNAGVSIRSLKDVFLMRSRTGPLWAVRQVGKRNRGAPHARGAREGPRGGSKLEFLYLLKRSVKQRGRFIFKLTAAEVDAAAPGIAQTHVAAFVRTVNG